MLCNRIHPWYQLCWIQARSRFKRQSSRWGITELFVNDFLSSQGSVSCRVVYMVFMVALRLSIGITLRSAEVFPNSFNGCSIRTFSKRRSREVSCILHSSPLWVRVCVFIDRQKNTCIYPYFRLYCAGDRRGQEMNVEFFSSPSCPGLNTGKNSTKYSIPCTPHTHIHIHTHTHTHTHSLSLSQKTAKVFFFFSVS